MLRLLLSIACLVVLLLLQPNGLLRDNDRAISVISPALKNPISAVSVVVGNVLGPVSMKAPGMFLTLAASLVTPSEAWSCRGDDKDKVRALAVERCKSCGGPGCGRCAHDTVQNAARCNFHGDDNREQYYHDTCGGCSGNPGPWYCVCSPGYVGSQCESLLSPYPTLSPTQFPTYYPTVSPSQTPSFRPTATPTVNPTPSPSQNPTATPSQLPTGQPSSSPSSAPSSSPTHQRTELILQSSSRGYFEVRTKPYNDHQRMLIGYGLGETCDVMMEKDPSSIYGTSTSELVSFPVMGNGSHGTFYQYDNEKKQHCFHNNIFILFENHENDYIQSISCCYDSMIDLTKDLPKIPEPIWKTPENISGKFEVKYSVCGKMPSPSTSTTTFAATSSSTTKAVQRCDLNETSVVPHGTQLTFSVATTALNNKLMKLHLLKVVGAATKGVRDFLYYDALAQSQTADFSLKSNDNATISWGLQALTFISKLRVTIEVVVVNSGQPNGARTRMLLEEMDILTGDMMSLVSSKSVRKADVNGNQMVIELIAPVAEEDQPVTGSTSSSHKEPSSEMPLLVWILGSVVAAMVIAGIACYVYWSRKVDPVDPVDVKPAIADAEKGRELSDVKEDVELPLTNIYSPKTEYEL